MILPPEKIFEDDEDIDNLLHRIVHGKKSLEFFETVFPSERKWKSMELLYCSKDIDEIIDGLCLSLEIGERCIQKISKESTHLRMNQIKILVECTRVSARDAKIYVNAMRENGFPEWMIRRATIDVNNIEEECLDFYKRYNLEVHDADV